MCAALYHEVTNKGHAAVSGGRGRRDGERGRIRAAGQLQLRDRLRGELRITVGLAARCR